MGVRRAVSPWPLVGLTSESPCGILGLRLCLPDPVILAAEIELDRITELLGEDRPPYASQARRPGEGQSPWALSSDTQLALNLLLDQAPDSFKEIPHRARAWRTTLPPRDGPVSVAPVCRHVIPDL